MDIDPATRWPCGWLKNLMRATGLATSSPAPDQVPAGLSAGRGAILRTGPQLAAEQAIPRLRSCARCQSRRASGLIHRLFV